MTSNLQPPTLTQVIALRLLREWGYDGLRAHVERVAQFYHAKRDVFEGLMRKHLDGLAEWATPEAGMFFWCVSSSLPSLLSPLFNPVYADVCGAVGSN